MVARGDAHKAIWIAEMNWNAVPPESGIAPNFGQVSLEEQARFAPLAYQRAQAEWPWVGMTAFWFFKRADDSERNQSWYYFRMAEPDFTLLPVYAAMQAYTQQTPTMYPGYFQEDHWAVRWSDGWQAAADRAAVLGAYQSATRVGASAGLHFDGSSLVLVTHRGPGAGQIGVRLDGGPERVHNLEAGSLMRPYPLALAEGLPAGPHSLEITVLAGAPSVDGFVVRRAPNRTGEFLAVLGLALGLVWYVIRRGNS
jgi:hypothetical protein